MATRPFKQFQTSNIFCIAIHATGYIFDIKFCPGRVDMKRIDCYYLCLSIQNKPLTEGNLQEAAFHQLCVTILQLSHVYRFPAFLLYDVCLLQYFTLTSDVNVEIVAICKLGLIKICAAMFNAIKQNYSCWCWVITYTALKLYCNFNFLITLQLKPEFPHRIA